MYVVDVIPFSRSVPPGSFSYRASAYVAPGSIIEVPLRARTVSALVVSISDVRERKGELKSATFSLLPALGRVQGVLPEPLMRAAQALAALHASAIGPILRALIGRYELTQLASATARGTSFEEDTVELPAALRHKAYSELIHTSAGGVLMLVPTRIEAEQARKDFKAFKPAVLAGTLSLKKQEAVQAAKLVIATPAHAWVPLQGLSRILVERVSAGSYIERARPYLDMRMAARERARAEQLPIVWGDYPLPLEYRTVPEAPLSQAHTVISTVADVRREVDNASVWRVFPEEILTKTRTASTAGGRTLVLAVRGGYAPTVVCRDCGTAVTDERGWPLSFSKEGGVPVMRSSDGSVRRAADTRCSRCESWNLLPLGVGAERVVEELRAAFPEATLAVFPSRSEPTVRERAEFLEAAALPGAFVIGTERMLTALPPDGSFALSVIASADSLLALPFWRARERFVRIALLLAQYAQESVILTRHPEDGAFSAITDPTHATFFTEEAMLRRAAGFPPFGTLITLTLIGTEAQATAFEHSVSQILKAYPHRLLPRRPALAGRFQSVVALTRTPEAWPDPALAHVLASLPPSIRLRIDPESF